VQKRLSRRIPRNWDEEKVFPRILHRGFFTSRPVDLAEEGEKANLNRRRHWKVILSTTGNRHADWGRAPPAPGIHLYAKAWTMFCDGKRLEGEGGRSWTVEGPNTPVKGWTLSQKCKEVMNIREKRGCRRPNGPPVGEEEGGVSA